MSPSLAALTEIAASGRALSPAESRAAALALATAGPPDREKQDFLVALARKGETVAEVAAFAQTFRELARNPRLEPWAERGLDLVGTGGDGFGTFNISTTAALVVAAAGVPVLKHGNRAITSRSGSTDFLERLGLAAELPEEAMLQSLRELNFVYLFAPLWHPAFRVVAPVRKALAQQGVRTIFNLLGPCLNPARPAHLLMGVFSEKWVEPLAAALHAVGQPCGMVVHGRLSEVSAGLDEITCAGDNRVVGCGRWRGLDAVWTAEDCGLRPCQPEVLKGGDAATNVTLFEELLAGSAPAGLADTVCLNAGVALWMAGAAPDRAAGLARAREVLTGGTLRQWWQRARTLHRPYLP